MERFRNRIRAKHNDIVERIRFLRVGRRGHIDQAETTVPIPDIVNTSLQYNRLTRDRTIRVLDLAPGTWDEPVNCSLRTVHLDDDNPRYEAISYAWGDYNDRKPIVCNGCAITTTRSLFEALQRFRRVDTTRTLWADALCINQADDDERTSQVRLMSYIYTKAVRVLVWLQHEDDEVVQKSLNAICRFVYKEDGFSRLGGFNDPPQPTPKIFYRWLDVDVTIINEMESPAIADAAIDALNSICGSPWFGRGWIVQEVALSTSASVFWGHGEIDFEWLGVASHAVNLDYPFESSHRGVHSCFYLVLVCKSSRHSNRLRQSFLNLLYSTTNMAFNEPKDRIYGLLGLKILECDTASGQSFIDPDYNITTMECYRRVAAKLLSECHDLRVLSWTRSVPQPAKDWPSWVPDWNEDPMRSFADFSDDGLPKKDTSGLAHISETSFGGVQCIKISGYRIDTINREIKEYGTLLDFFKNDGCYELEAFQAFLRRLDHIYGQQCLAFTFGNPQRHLPLDSVRITNVLSEYRAFLERDFVQDIPSFAGTWVNDREDRFVPSADRFATRCFVDGLGRCLFITSTEMLGIGPQAMIPGDVVVVLHGGQVPFVLRPADNGLWRFVGDCYLYDVNEGRFHREWEEKGSVSEKFTIC